MFPPTIPTSASTVKFLKDTPELLGRPELSHSTKRKILHDNAKEFDRI